MIQYKYMRCWIQKLIILLSLLISNNTYASPMTHFNHTERNTIVSPLFVDNLIKSTGVEPVSHKIQINNSITTEYYQFQKNPLAPFQVSLSQDQLTIKWLEPKANTQEMYKVNALNRTIAKNLSYFLFGNDAIINEITTIAPVNKQLTSHNQKWQINLSRQGIEFQISIKYID